MNSLTNVYLDLIFYLIFSSQSCKLYVVMGYQRCDDSRNVRVCFAKCLAMITICFLPVG